MNKKAKELIEGFKNRREFGIGGVDIQVDVKNKLIRIDAPREYGKPWVAADLNACDVTSLVKELFLKIELKKIEMKE